MTTANETTTANAKSEFVKAFGNRFPLSDQAQQFGDYVMMNTVGRNSLVLDLVDGTVYLVWTGKATMWLRKSLELNTAAIIETVR